MESSAPEESGIEESKSSLMTSTMSVSDTTATRKHRRGDPAIAPYLYTTRFNTRQDLLFCGGAGKNEMRVFDWESGSIVANISNLPKAITCSGQALNSSMFAVGSGDSRIRIFDIEKQSRQQPSAAKDSASQASSVFSRK